MALLNCVGLRKLLIFACLMMVLLTIMLFGLSPLSLLPTISLSSSTLFLPVNCMILALLASGGFFSRNAIVVSETCNACVSVSFSDGNLSAREAEMEGAIVVSCEYVEEKTIVCIDDRAFHDDSLVLCSDDSSYDDRSLVPCADSPLQNSCRELVPTSESASSPMDAESMGDDSCRSLVPQPSPRKKTKKPRKNPSFRRKKVETDLSGEKWIVRASDQPHGGQQTAVTVRVELENLSQHDFNNVVSSYIDLRRQEWLLIGNAP